MIVVGLVMLLVVTVTFGLTFWHLWLRAHDALAEWRRRWEQAPELCAVPGCAQPLGADCHVEWEFDEAIAKKWEKHRPVPGRLVPLPILVVREGIGRE